MARSFTGNWLDSAGSPIGSGADPQVTIAVWAWHNGSLGNDDTIVQISDGTNNEIYELRKQTSDQLGFICFNGSGSGTAISFADIPQNEWFHACAVLTSLTDRAVYLNGSTDKGTNTSSIAMTGFNKWDIGTQNGGDVWQGNIAEVAIWNVPLSDFEIDLLAKRRLSPLFVRPRNLVQYRLLRPGMEHLELGTGYLKYQGAGFVNHVPGIVYPLELRRVPAVAAAGGLSIPVAMHGYRHRRTG